MADRGPDVRRLLSQLGLSAETRHATKAPAQPAPPRELNSDTLAAFFDSVRRAPPRAVTEVPPTVDRTAPPSGSMEQTVLLSTLQPERPTPGTRVLSETELSPPTLRIDLPPITKVQVVSPAPATAEVTPILAPPAETVTTPLSEVFRRLVDAGLRRR